MPTAEAESKESALSMSSWRLRFRNPDATTLSPVTKELQRVIPTDTAEEFATVPKIPHQTERLLVLLPSCLVMITNVH